MLRLIPLLISCLIFTCQIFPQSFIAEKIDSLVTLPIFDTVGVSVTVYNLTEGREIYSKNPHRLMRPASNMKILTGAAGLYFLGKDYKFITRFTYTGNISDGILDGDLFVVGGGDPDFSLSDLNSAADALVNIGVKRIRGKIYGDISLFDSLYWGNGWMWDDDPSTDFPFMTPLVLNDNSVTVSVSWNEEKKAVEIKTKPDVPSFKVLTNIFAGDTGRTDLSITRDILYKTITITVTGYLRKGSSAVTSTFCYAQPEKIFMESFIHLLNNRDIQVAEYDFAEYQGNGREFFSVERDILPMLNNLEKASDNLSAEMTLRALGKLIKAKRISADDGIKMIDSLIRIIGLTPEDYRIVDGSGVSHYNLLSVNLLVQLLKYFFYAEPGLYDILKTSFPIAGVDGTLRNRMKKTAAEGNVYAKTGTLSGVTCLSGYVSARNGDVLCFSIMMQNHHRKLQNLLAIQNQICTLLASYNE